MAELKRDFPSKHKKKLKNDLDKTGRSEVMDRQNHHGHFSPFLPTNFDYFH
jgi:hypothetical protein